jgi:hypothetical protein
MQPIIAGSSLGKDVGDLSLLRNTRKRANDDSIEERNQAE